MEYLRESARKLPRAFRLGMSFMINGLLGSKRAGQAVSAHLFKLELGDFPQLSKLADRCFELPAFKASHPFEQPAFKTAKGH